MTHLVVFLQNQVAELEFSKALNIHVKLL